MKSKRLSSFLALFFCLLFAGNALAVNVSHIPSPRWQFFSTSTGKPLVGGKLYTYSAGTTTPLATYTDSTGSTPNTNPIVLDSRGEASIWVGSGLYKFVLKDAAGNTIWTEDNHNLYDLSAINSSITLLQNENSIYKYDIEYATLAAADAAAVAAGKTLLITKQWNTVQTTILSNVYMTTGGKLNNAGSVTFSGSFDADISTHFMGSGSVTISRKMQVVPQWWGATGDGATDDAAAIQSALNNSTSVFLPMGTYRCGSGIIVPSGVTLFGNTRNFANPSLGTQLLFDLSVATCLTVGSTPNSNQSGSVYGLSVIRAAGTVPAGSIGVLVSGGYNINLSYLGSFRHAIAFKFLGDASGNGISAFTDHLYTGVISDSHVVIDTWPEARFHQCRFGMNGSGDVSGNSFIRIQGGSATSAQGPNTVNFSGCHFNLGNGVKNTSWIEFKNKTASALGDTLLWQMSNNYVESVSNYITSDSSWTSIGRLFISGSDFNAGGSNHFLNLDAATAINDWEISNNIIYADFVFSSGASQINSLLMSNNQFNGLVSLNGIGTNCVVNLIGNNYKGGLTLTGVFSKNSWAAGSITGSVLTLTATGIGVDVGPYNTGQAWTPAVQFGGASVGVTYTTDAGWYTIRGRTVQCEFKVTLTSKGSSTGVFKIGGLPYTIANALGSHGVGRVSLYDNMSSITQLLVGGTELGTTIEFSNGSSTSNASLTDTNLSNTSIIYGGFTYNF